MKISRKFQNWKYIIKFKSSFENPTIPKIHLNLDNQNKRLIIWNNQSNRSILKLRTSYKIENDFK